MMSVKRASMHSRAAQRFPTEANRAALNRHIAARITHLAACCGVGENDLGGTSISPELFARYQSGTVRVTPVHLLELATLFGVQIADFFNHDPADPAG